MEITNSPSLDGLESLGDASLTVLDAMAFIADDDLGAWIYQCRAHF